MTKIEDPTGFWSAVHGWVDLAHVMFSFLPGPPYEARHPSRWFEVEVV